MAAFNLDEAGRRCTLYWGAVALFTVLFIIGGLYRGALDNLDEKEVYGTAAATRCWYRSCRRASMRRPSTS